MQLLLTRRNHALRTGFLVLFLASALLAGSILLIHSVPTHADSGVPVTLNWNQTYQRMDGFGISNGWSTDFLQSFPEPARSQMIEMLFSQDRGIGLSIDRLEIGSGDGNPLTSTAQTIEPSQGNFTWDVNAGAVWFIHQAQSYGVNQFFAAPWSAPAWMKTNNNTRGGGSLRTDMYQAYADYLAAFIQGYQSHFNIPITQISLQNEPDIVQDSYPTMSWTGAQFETVIRDYLKPTFARNGITTKVVMPEPACWHDVDTYADPTLNDSAAAAGVDIVASHDYCNEATTPITLAQQKGKTTWMSEDSNATGPVDPWIADGLTWANRIHNNIVGAGSSAWLWWMGTVPYSISNGDNQGLLYQNDATHGFDTTKRLFTLGNYSRFIRPGYVRIGAPTNPTSSINLSAYKDPASGKTVIVAINNGTSSQALNISINGYNPTYLTPYVTTDLESLEQNTSVPFSGGSAAVTLLPSSVTTFVSGTGAVPTAVQDPLIDLSQMYSHSANLGIEQSNPATFDGDYSRLFRTTNTNENAVYRVSGGSSVSIRDYYWHDQSDNGVSFNVSSNGTNWTAVTPSQDSPRVMNGGDWYELNYTVAIPSNASYLQINIPSNADYNWTPQISHITLGATPGGGGSTPTPTPSPTPGSTPTPTPTPPSGGGTLTISSASTTGNTNYLSNSYDGTISNLGSYNCFVLMNGQSVTYNLSSVATLSSMKLAPGVALNPVSYYDVQVLQGGTWNTVLSHATFPTTTGSFTTISIGSNPTNVQAVKLIADSDWLYIDEIQFVGAGSATPTPTPPPGGALAISSASTTGNTNYLSNSYDGTISNLGSYNCFVLMNGQSVTYNLGSASTLSSMKLAPGVALNPVGYYDVQVLQGGTWNTVLSHATFPTTTGSFTTISIGSNPSNVQAVKMIADSDWLYIDEIQFIGTHS